MIITLLTHHHQAESQTMMLVGVYRVNKAVGARLLVLVDLVDDQEHHTHQEGQGTDHQQGHLQEIHNSSVITCIRLLKLKLKGSARLQY